MSIQTFVYDADGPDSSVELDESVVKGLGERQLLWIDIVGGDEQELERVGTLLQLERESIDSLRNSRDQPQLRSYTDYFQLNVVAVREEGPRYKAIELDFLAGPNYVVTVHSAAVDFLKRFDNQLRGETKIGKLTSDAFLAALLDWHITSYFHVLSAMELEVDQLDDQILQNPAERRFLSELVSFRRRIGELRRLLTPHRDVFAALARVDFEAIANTESAAYFRALNERFELLIDAIESARDLVHGSFDLYATGTDLRTNDIVRVLTVATVLTGAASVVAGIMGMNFEIDLFKSGLLGFVLVIIGICVLCAGILGLARWRRWL